MPYGWVEAGVAVYGAYESSQKDSGGGGGGGGGYSSGTQQNMQAADPFASQRFQYQQALAKLMGMGGGQSNGYPAPAGMGAPAGFYGGAPAAAPSSPTGPVGNFTGRENPYFSSIGGGTSGNSIGSGAGYIYRPSLTGPAQPSSLSTAQGNPGPAFVPSDPSYNFRLQSGSEAVQRAMGAKGMNGSGNMMAALMQYGQNLGSTEYQNEFNRLAILSGAESGSPAAAGQLGLQGQQMQQNTDAATLAQWNQWLQPAAKAVGGWLGSNGNSSGSSGGGDGGGGTAGGGSSYSDPFTSDAYTT